MAVRIQKADEDLAIARKKLILASRSKKCSLMILVRTHGDNNRLLPLEFDDKLEIGNNPNILIIDAYDFLIESWLKTHVY